MRHEIHTKYRLLLSINMSHADKVRCIYCIVSSLFILYYTFLQGRTVCARKPCGSANTRRRTMFTPASMCTIIECVFSLLAIRLTLFCVRHIALYKIHSNV